MPSTTILTEYIKKSTTIQEQNIETVEVTTGEEYIDYTIVTKTT